MNAPTTRAFTPSRIVALALIGLMILGLSYLRYAPGPAPIAVPAGATAGDLRLEPCTYPTEAGIYSADCGTLVVPENRANPQSRLIALPVTRVRARSEHPGAPVFHLAGGPGATNMMFPEASRLADSHDVILVGYRGIDGSSVLACPEVTSVLKHSTDFLAAETLRAEANAYGACAERLQHSGVDLAGYTLGQRVDDLEAARGALGYDRIDLVGESVGSRIAMIYSWRYPASIDRSVMIGVNPPGHFLWDPQTTDEQIGRYAALCAQDTGCSERTDDLAASMRRTASQIPDRWLFLPIKEGNVRFASFFALMESTAKTAPLSAPMTLSAWLAAADGDPSGLWFLSLMADMFFPNALVWGDTAATGKAAGNDIWRRKKSLPVVYAFQHASPSSAEALCRIYRAKEVGPREVEQVMAVLAEVGAREYCLAQARERAALSVQSVLHLGLSGWAASNLEAMVEFLVERDY